MGKNKNNLVSIKSTPIIWLALMDAIIGFQLNFLLPLNRSEMIPGVLVDPATQNKPNLSKYYNWKVPASFA